MKAWGAYGDSPSDTVPSSEPPDPQRPTFNRPRPGHSCRQGWARLCLRLQQQQRSVCTDNHELSEEMVASDLYHVHLYHSLEVNDYGHFLTDNDL